VKTVAVPPATAPRTETRTVENPSDRNRPDDCVSPDGVPSGGVSFERVSCGGDGLGSGGSGGSLENLAS